jgi:L-histidine N-alpha-methyltransferase
VTGSATSDRARALAEEVGGLLEPPRELSPKWFYDARGGQLFEQITELPEYYPTRAERAILEAHADELVAGPPVRTLVELGSGTSRKTRLLIDALRSAGSLERFVPFDVDRDTLQEAVTALGREYPGLAVTPVVGDFTVDLGLLRHLPGPVLVAFLGGTVGNLLPEQRKAFLAGLRSVLVPGDGLLLGTDLVKDPARLVAAYDDSAGVTAEFNRNVLAVINRELGVDIPLDAFDHVARWDPDNEWVEMRLRASRPVEVELPALGRVLKLTAGDEIRTEVSAKFRRERLESELTEAGFTPVGWWTDPAGDFAVSRWGA